MSRQAFTTCSTLTIGCYLYQESSLINPWGAGIYFDGTTCWVVNSSGQITTTSTCAPEPIYYTANKYYGDGTCELIANNVVVYSSFSVPFFTWACGDSGYMYFITGETTAGSYDADLVSTKFDCTDGCP